MLNRNRRNGRSSVAQRRLEIYQSDGAALLRGTRHIDRTADVGRHVLRPVCRILVGSGAVNHHLGPKRRKTAIHQGCVGDRTFLHGQSGHAGGQDLAFAGRKIVDDMDLVAFGQPVLDQVGSEATRAACDQYAHRCRLPFFVAQMRVTALRTALAVVRDRRLDGFRQRRELDPAKILDGA